MKAKIIAVLSWAAPTPGSLWAETKPPCFAFGAKNEVRSPIDLSTDLIVQLGNATEDLNRRWYERNTSQAIESVQKRIYHPVIKWMAATVDGLIQPGGAVFEAKFMLPWTFSEEAAAEKHMAQLQHNMWVANARSAVLSIITGGGNGSRWWSGVIRSTSTCCSLRKRSSGGA